MAYHHHKINLRRSNSMENNFDYKLYHSIKDSMLNTIEYVQSQYENEDADFLFTDFENLKFHMDDLIILAGKKFVGKTAFAVSLINQFAITKKKPVGITMPGKLDSKELCLRLISMNSGISYHKFRSGMLSKDDFEKMKTITAPIYDAPIFTYSDSNCHFGFLKDVAKQMHEQADIRLFIVDDFDYMDEYLNSPEYIDELLEKFKKLAKELHIPIILVMNIFEEEDGVQPGLHSFKRNMMIPNKADMVILLHRIYRAEERDFSSAELIVVKNEHGISQDIQLKFYPGIMKFENL